MCRDWRMAMEGRSERVEDGREKGGGRGLNHVLLLQPSASLRAGSWHGHGCMCIKLHMYTVMLGRLSCVESSQFACLF